LRAEGRRTDAARAHSAVRPCDGATRMRHVYADADADADADAAMTACCVHHGGVQMACRRRDARAARGACAALMKGTRPCGCIIWLRVTRGMRMHHLARQAGRLGTRPCGCACRRTCGSSARAARAHLSMGRRCTGPTAPFTSFGQAGRQAGGRVGRLLPWPLAPPLPAWPLPAWRHRCLALGQVCPYIDGD
jgi:hypothetical protein